MVVARQSNGLTSVGFDPSMFGLVARAARITAADAIAAGGFDAVLNGPMFDELGAGAVRLSAGLLAPGLRVESRHAGQGETWSFVGGQIERRQGWLVAPGATYAVQLYPQLVSSGYAMTLSRDGANAERVWRSALAQRGGEAFFVVGVDSLASFASRLASAGYSAAAYTDGGSSTTLAIRGGTSHGAAGVNVPVWLGVRSSSSSAVTSSSVSAGAVAGVLAVSAALTALGTVAYVNRDVIKKALSPRPRRRRRA